MQVMSPAIFRPGTAEVKSRFTRSGIGPAWPWTVVTGRQGRGWGGGPPRPPHPLPARPLEAPAGRLRPQPPVAVGAVGVLEGLPDQQPEFLASPRGRALRP